MGNSLMDIEWLQKRVTVAEAEAAHMVIDDRLGPAPVAFGLRNNHWRHMIEPLREGDELWAYRSPPDTWAKRAGREGYCIVRDGQVIADIWTFMN